MLAGRRAFHKDSAADTISAILREDLAGAFPKRAVTSTHRSIVWSGGCLEKNREQRFHSASDLAFALEALSGTQVSGATTAVATAEILKSEHRRKLIDRLGWVAAALLLAAILALSVLYFRRAEPRAQTMRFTLVRAGQEKSYRGELALSPDGRRLAFVVTGAGGRSLWVRALDSVEARELPGTAEAHPAPSGRRMAASSDSLRTTN